MSSDDYTLQVSYRFGAGQQHMANVRADDAGELRQNLDSMDDDVVSSIVNLGARLTTTGPLAEQFAASPISAPESQTQAAPAPAAPPVSTGFTALKKGTLTEVPPCVHGGRKVVRKPEWTGYFCFLPKGVAGSCAPFFADPA